MTTKMLEDMARFYLERYFDGIPYIPVTFDRACCLDGALGSFVMRPGDDYCMDEDELIDAPGYRVRHVTVLDNTGYWLADEESWKDPINHPVVFIRISRKIQRDIRQAVATLLHELMHYYCWYMGYDYSDSDYGFNRMCMDRGIPTNYYDNAFHDGCWHDTFDYTSMDRHIQAYYENKEAGYVDAA